MKNCLAAVCLTVGLLQGCSSGSDSDPEPQYAPGTVGIFGEITGLSGEVTISINGAQEVLTTNGSFQAQTRVTDNESYSISFVSSSEDLNCNLENGSGTANGNITNVVISCDAATFTAYDLNALAFNTEQPSVVTFAFHLIDRYTGVALDNLTRNNITDHLIVEENGMPISATESFLEIDKFLDFNAEYTTVYAIDISSSLSERELESVIDAIKTSLVYSDSGTSKLQSNQKVSIITFDSDVETVIEAEHDTNKIFDALDSIELGGPSTNLYGAIESGASMWSNQISLEQISYGSLILFTDGNDTSSRVTKSDALKSSVDKDTFFIAVGSETNTSILSEFTSESNIFALDNFEQLSATLDETVERIKTFEDGLYILSYATPKRAGKHTLTISTNDDYLCDFAVTEVETSQMSNQGSLTACDDSHDFEFNADGFTDVETSLTLSGNKVTRSSQTSWQAKMRWTRESPDYTWFVEVCEGNISYTLSSNKSSISFSRTSSTRATANVKVVDNVTLESAESNLIMVATDGDLTRSGVIASKNSCNP